MTIIKNFIAYASWYIGRKEKPGNSGWFDAKFEKEMVSAGWLFGDAWCATFIRMILLKLLTGDLLTAAKSQFNAGAKSTFDRVKKAGIFATGDVPEEGAIVVWLHGHGPTGHEGLVTVVSQKTNTMSTIEANTNASGSREGNTVAAKLRTINREFTPTGLNVYGYIYLRKKNE